MAQVKISDLSGAALEWSVAKCEGFIQDDDPVWERGDEPFAYSTDWSLGGPIIERIHGLLLKQWLDCKPDLRCQVQISNHEGDWIAFGPTPLIAAMRCFVASKLGDVVDVPEELL